MGLGYVKFSVDYEAVEKALQTKEGKKELKKFVDVTPITISTPAKIKVNTKRASVNNSETKVNETDEILVIEDIGTNINKTQKSYENAVNKLSSGNANLIKRAEEFVQLGVKPKKQLSSKFLTLDNEE